MKALIIEDEKNLSRFLELELKDNGFGVDIAYDGEEGLRAAINGDHNIILLDWMLPGKDGIQVLRELRQKKSTPVIMITARDSVDSEVEGLEQGATDYLKKPFDNRQLVARVNAVLRRDTGPKNKKAEGILECGDVEINLKKWEVKRNGNLIDVSKTEFDLLSLFMKNPGQVLTRDIILERCWGYSSSVDTNVVDVYINHLRKKIDKKEFIRTVRGVGYILDE